MSFCSCTLKVKSKNCGETLDCNAKLSLYISWGETYIVINCLSPDRVQLHSSLRVQYLDIMEKVRHSDILENSAYSSHVLRKTWFCVIRTRYRGLPATVVWEEDRWYNRRKYSRLQGRLLGGQRQTGLDPMPWDLLRKISTYTMASDSLSGSSWCKSTLSYGQLFVWVWICVCQWASYWK